MRAGYKLCRSALQQPRWHLEHRAAPCVPHAAWDIGYSTSGASSSSRGQGSKAGLSWQQLYTAAKLAQWSGFCYLDAADLQQALQRQTLSLVAQGRSRYTSWYVADGHIDSSELVSKASRAAAEEAAEAPQQQQRFVFLRGVQWSAPDMDALQMWQDLARFWPVPFAHDLTVPPGMLVAHGGVAELAGLAYQELAPYLEEVPADMHITLAGHSLGGAFAQLLTCLTRLRPASGSPRSLSCYTFGSPSVLAHKDGGRGHRALQLMGMSPKQCQSFVLENDPIPRAMLSVDPAFQVIKEWGGVRQLLELRRQLLGEGSMLSPGRFLFETLGEVYLIRWSSADGCSVVALDPHEMESELQLSSSSSSSSAFDLMKSMQAWLDHHHHSYYQELEAAAIIQYRGVMQQQAQGSR